MGVGGRIGSGDQTMPWIHIDDLTEMIVFAIQNKNVDGVLNGVAPSITSNSQFSAALGRAMWRPWFLPVPSFVVRSLLGDRADMLLCGQKVVPRRVQELGFQFKHAEVNEAIRSALYE
jgi:uncharacterized protein (TIGR01777 family)